MANCSHKFTCINCGRKVNELCKKYSATVLKLVACENCGRLADKYIEYDPVIVMIDLILLRQEAYSHILYNTEFKCHWKLAVMVQMMEVYSEWTLTSKYKTASNDDTKIMYNMRDLLFYLLGVRVFFRTLCSFFMMCFLTLIYNKILKKSIDTKISLENIWKAFVLSNFGWFLFLPTLIWDNTVQAHHLSFVSLYTTLSQLLAYTVVCKCIKLWSIVVIILSYNFKVFSNELYDVFYNFVNDYFSQ